MGWGRDNGRPCRTTGHTRTRTPSRFPFPIPFTLPPPFHRDVVEVIRSPQLQAQFLLLPFAAVAALARSDALAVDSENSVAVR